MKQPLRFLPAFLLILAAAFAAWPAYAQEAPPVPEPEQALPFVLSPAHPNPFNPATQFTLSMQATQEVRVEVFNMLGQRVRLLYDGVLEAGEERTFTFDANDLPSGLYLYRAQGKSFVTTRQVTLLK